MSYVTLDRICQEKADKVARPIAKKLRLADDMVVDWLWIGLLALWQRWCSLRNLRV